MILDNLNLKNFRIHKSNSLQFSPHLNFIVGGNGQGKTSLLESMYFLCTTKNFKTTSDREMLRFGEEMYEIDGNFSGFGDNNVKIRYSDAEAKRNYILNNKIISRSQEVIGKFPVVLLTPEDHALTQGSPAERRKFADTVVSQSSALYLETLLDYNKTLKQRTVVLNKLRENYRSSLQDELDAWDMKLVRAGTELTRMRRNFLNEFSVFIHQAYRTIMASEEVPEVQYISVFQPDEEISEISFAKKLVSRRNEEIRRSANLTGPHRDDLLFLVNGKSLKVFGSQGQHKTFQVALRFAQFFFLKEKTGQNPVFLLDDVFGELDKRRALKISEYLKSVGQAFITITDFSNFNYLATGPEDLVLKLKNGVVTDE